MNKLRPIYVILLLNILCFGQGTVISGTSTSSGSLSINSGSQTIQLQTITVAPPSPNIGVGSQQSFTALGTYSDSSTADLTGLAVWASASTGVATISGSIATCVARGTSVISATYQTIVGSTTLTCAAPTFSPQGTFNIVQSSSAQVIQVFTGTNGTPNYTFSSSDLPGFLSLSTSADGQTCISGQVSCLLNGTPSTLGLFLFHVQLTDSLSHTACPAPGCPIGLNVVAQSAEDNIYCTNSETVTGLTDESTAIIGTQMLLNCNNTAIANTPATGGQTVYVCPQGELISTVAVPGCAALPTPPLTLTTQNSRHTSTNCQTTSGTVYCETIQDAWETIATSAAPCGNQIVLYTTLDDATHVTQNIYTEDVIPLENVLCGPDHNQPYNWIVSSQFSNLPPPGTRITPAWTGQSTIIGRPNYNQLPAGQTPGIYLPMWRCTFSGASCVSFSAAVGNTSTFVIDGLRIMGIYLATPHGRNSTTDVYGQHICPSNGDTTSAQWQCSPGVFGSSVFGGCNISGSGKNSINCDSSTSGFPGSQHIIFDRDLFSCDYIPQVTNPPNVKDCADTITTWVDLSGSRHDSIIDSYLLQAWCDDLIGPCVDSHAITGGNPPSFFGNPPAPPGTGNDYSTKIVDNYIEATGENLFIGGGNAALNVLSTDWEIRRNDIFKPLTWLVIPLGSTSLFPGVIYDSFVANSKQGAGYRTGTTCTVDPPLSGTTAQCTPVIGTVATYTLTNIVGNGSVATANCATNCKQVGVGGYVVIASTTHFNGTQLVTGTAGTSVTSFTFASASNNTDSGGTATVSGILDVFVCPTAPCAASAPAGTGYGPITKSTGKTAVTHPNFYFTDGSITYTSGGSQMSGTVNSAIVGGNQQLSWKTGNYFLPFLAGTTITIKTNSTCQAGAVGSFDYTISSVTSSILLVISTTLTNQFTNCPFTTNLPSRGDNYDPLDAIPNVKNPGEYKNGIRILHEGNVMTNNWGGQSDQDGSSFLITPRNASNNCPSCQVTDVVERYNLYRNMNKGITIGANAATQGHTLSQGVQRVSIHDDIFDGLNGYYWTSGTATISGGGGDCVSISNVNPIGSALQSIYVNHIECIGTLPTGQSMSNGSALSMFYNGFLQNDTTPAPFQYISLTNSIAGGGAKNNSALFNGLTSCGLNSCGITHGSTTYGPTETSMREVLVSDWMLPVALDLYESNIVQGIALSNGIVNTDNSGGMTWVSGTTFDSSLIGQEIYINGSYYTVLTVPSTIAATIDPPAGSQTSIAWAGGGLGGQAGTCNPSTCTISPPAGTSGANAKCSVATSSGAVSKIFITDPGSRYFGVTIPTVSFSGGTCGSGGLPTAVTFWGGAVSDLAGSACFDHLAMPLNAWSGIINMSPYPTTQVDPVNNRCLFPAGGHINTNTAGTPITVNTWADLKFIGFNGTSLGTDANGAECNGLNPPSGGGANCAPPDLHLLNTSPFFNAGSDGLNFGANIDLVLGKEDGTPSPYTGCFINGLTYVCPRGSR